MDHSHHADTYGDAGDDATDELTLASANNEARFWDLVPNPICDGQWDG